MRYKTLQFLTALFSLFPSACVSQTDAQDFDKLQAAKARIDLALGYLAQNNQEQAKLNLDKALSYAPDYYLVHSALAYFYQQQGNIEQAEKSYLQAIKSDNRQGDTFNNYGTFLCSQGKFHAAYQQFNLALSTPNYYRQADTYENMALCALAENNERVYRESLALLEKTDAGRAQRLRQRAQTTSIN